MNEYERIITEAGFLVFANTENIIASVIKVAKQKSLMKISASSGTGKTTALRIIAQKIVNSAFVTVYDGMTAKEFLEDLSISVGIKTPQKSAKDMMRELKVHLTRNNRLIIIDEANFLKERSLEQLRHINDLCSVGVVLAGTEELDMTISKSHPQVASRIRNSLEVKRFGAAEVAMLCKKYNCLESKAEILATKKRNLREIEYFLQDYIEIYGLDENHFAVALKSL